MIPDNQENSNQISWVNRIASLNAPPGKSCLMGWWHTSTDSHNCISCAEETMRLTYTKNTTVLTLRLQILKLWIAEGMTFIQDFWEPTCWILYWWVELRHNLLPKHAKHVTWCHMFHEAWNFCALNLQEWLHFECPTVLLVQFLRTDRFAKAVTQWIQDLQTLQVQLLLSVIQMLHVCINVQNWRSTAPWRNLFLFLLEKTAINMDGSALRIPGSFVICASPRFREIDCKSCSSVRDARESSLASQQRRPPNRHHTLEQFAGPPKCPRQHQHDVLPAWQNVFPAGNQQA